MAPEKGKREKPPVLSPLKRPDKASAQKPRRPTRAIKQQGMIVLPEDFC